jgi:hypothetical protein
MKRLLVILLRFAAYVIRAQSCSIDWFKITGDVEPAQVALAKSVAPLDIGARAER